MSDLYNAIVTAAQPMLRNVWNEVGFDPRWANVIQQTIEDPETADIAGAVHQFFGGLPHPQAPSIKVADYPTAARLTAATKYSSKITPKEVEGFWQEFNSLNQGLGDRAMAPDQYLHALDKIAPLSWVYHGRPPTMTEIGQMHDAPPDKVRGYYYNLPDQNYPDVPAGDMVKALQAAKPFAQMSLGRDPLKIEARYLYHGGLVGSPDAISAHYQMLAQPPPAPPGVGIVKSEEGGLWTPQPGGFGAPPPRQPEGPSPLMGPFRPAPGTFGAPPVTSEPGSGQTAPPLPTSGGNQEGLQE